MRGDVVQLETGTRVPADIRVLTAESLKLDKSSFTGESDPEVSKRREHVRGVGLAPVRMYKALRMCTLQRSALDHQNTKKYSEIRWACWWGGPQGCLLPLPRQTSMGVSIFLGESRRARPASRCTPATTHACIVWTDTVLREPFCLLL